MKEKDETILSQRKRDFTNICGSYECINRYQILRDNDAAASVILLRCGECYC